MNILRKILVALPVALGLVAVASEPASAGIVLNNHCGPDDTAFGCRQQQ